MKRITILLADDHAMGRRELRKMLEMEGNFAVVGEAKDGRRAVELAQELRPDVILMDIGMPLLNGLEATRQTLQALPATKVLMLSAHSDEAYVAEALRAGAVGFLAKQKSSFEDICEAIREVQKGNTIFNPSISQRHSLHRQSSDSQGPLKKKAACLTARERQILQQIAEGKSSRDIAAKLGLSAKTLEKQRQSLMDKLGLHDTAGLTRYAIRMGLIECGVQLTIVDRAVKENPIQPWERPARAGLQGQTSKPPRILMVDDEPLIRELNTDLLIGAGYRVDAAANGAAAWATLQLHKYDLIITDNTMPRMTGLQMLEKMQAVGVFVPVIVASGTFPKTEAASRPRLRPAATLPKPYTPMDLLATVKKVLGTPGS